jgi:hypothetical protein
MKPVPMAMRLMMTCRMVYVLRLIPRIMVDFLSLLGIEPLLPDAAYQMSEKDVVMWEFLFILPFPPHRNCAGTATAAVMVGEKQISPLRCSR